MSPETAIVPASEGIEVITREEPLKRTPPPRIKKAIPALSPLIACPVVCQQCGETIHPKVVKGSTVVQHLLYQHINEEYGCRYEVESTAMLTGESRMLRADNTRVQL